MPSAPSTRTSPDQTVQVVESRLTAALYEPFLWLAERRGMAARRSPQSIRSSRRLRS